MAHIKFYHYNLVSQAATVISTDNENALFPSSNLKDHRTTKVCRSNTGTTTQIYTFDFVTIENVDALLFVPSSTQGFGFDSVTIEANTIDSWGAPAFTTSLSVDADMIKFGFAHKLLSADETYRYWRLTFSNSGGSYVEVGKIFIGDTLTLADNNIDFGWTYENKDRSSFQRNRYGQKFIDIINDQLLIRGKFNLLNQTEMETLADMFDTNGKSIPVWCILDTDEDIVNDLERFAGYFFFNKRPRITNDSVKLYSLAFSLEGAT